MKVCQIQSSENKWCFSRYIILNISVNQLKFSDATTWSGILKHCLVSVEPKNKMSIEYPFLSSYCCLFIQIRLSCVTIKIIIKLPTTTETDIVL